MFARWLALTYCGELVLHYMLDAQSSSLRSRKHPVCADCRFPSTCWLAQSPYDSASLNANNAVPVYVSDQAVFLREREEGTHRVYKV